MEYVSAIINSAWSTASNFLSTPLPSIPSSSTDYRNVPGSSTALVSALVSDDNDGMGSDEKKIPSSIKEAAPPIIPVFEGYLHLGLSNQPNYSAIVKVLVESDPREKLTHLTPYREEILKMIPTGFVLARGENILGKIFLRGNRIYFLSASTIKV